MLTRRGFPAVVALALVLTTPAWSTPQEKVDLAMVDKIREEGLQRSQVMDLISFMTDVHGPRLTNSPEMRRACEWARGKLSSWGLENARLEPWGPFGRGWSLEGFTANMVEPSFSPLIAWPKAWSPGTTGVVRGEPVYLDASKDEDLEKYKSRLAGAIVLLSPPREVKAWFEPPGMRQSDEKLLALANAAPGSSGGAGPGGPARLNLQLSPEQRAAMAMQGRKWQLVHAEKAAVVLEPGRGDGGTIFVGSATLPGQAAAPFSRSRPWAPDAPAAVPQVVLAAEHYNRIVRMLQKGARVKLEVGLQTRFHGDDLMAHNVIAEIPGTDLKDEVVMLGAHFDAWHSGTGATDNAAGSGVCMEVVRILRALGSQPRRTIRIALWSGEEQGLLGSRAYVAQHFGSRTESGKFELKPGHARLAGYFNLDNGTGKIRGIHLQGNEGVRPVFRAWLAPFREMGASTVTPTNTGGTDHLAFDAVGIPGFQFIQDPIEYETRTHHSNMDVYDRIQEEDMKQAAVVMASFVWLAAVRDEKLPRKPLAGEVVTTPGK